MGPVPDRGSRVLNRSPAKIFSPLQVFVKNPKPDSKKFCKRVPPELFSIYSCGVFLIYSCPTRNLKSSVAVPPQAMVAEKPKKETPMPAMPPGGGMDY
jgi:hypothetical protein